MAMSGQTGIWSHLNLSYLIINEHFNNYSTKSGEEKGKQTLG